MSQSRMGGAGGRRPGRGRPGGRPGGRRGGGSQRKPEAPMLLGEPSPALAQINAMNMAKLELKIASLVSERKPLEKKVERLEAMDPKPTERIDAMKQLIVRLETLEDLARKRLEGKAERKAQREQRGL